MTTISISEFKSKCIAILKEARRSGDVVLVTWRGRPMARVEPIRGAEEERRLGAYRGRMQVMCDLVHADTADERILEYPHVRSLDARL
jgi:prevent-host-death family protein